MSRLPRRYRCLSIVSSGFYRNTSSRATRPLSWLSALLLQGHLRRTSGHARTSARVCLVYCRLNKPPFRDTIDSCLTDLEHAIDDVFDKLVKQAAHRGLLDSTYAIDAAIFEWQEGSIFFIPQSVPYKHINLSASEAAHLFAQTTFPHLLELAQYEDPIFDPETDHWVELLGDKDFFSSTANSTSRSRRRDRSSGGEFHPPYRSVRQTPAEDIPRFRDEHRFQVPEKCHSVPRS